MDNRYHGVKSGSRYRIHKKLKKSTNDKLTKDRLILDFVTDMKTDINKYEFSELDKFIIMNNLDDLINGKIDVDLDHILNKNLYKR